MKPGLLKDAVSALISSGEAVRIKEDEQDDCVIYTDGQ
jgi:hypothetical protein